MGSRDAKMAERTVDIPPLNNIQPSDPFPSGWEPWIVMPSKPRTLYRVEAIDGVSALRADAVSSASGLITRLALDLQNRPLLEWRWRIQGLIPGADNGKRHAEDAPARLMLAFDGDKSKLSLKDMMFFEQVRMFAGHDMPYATLMYIWADHKPVGTIIRNPNTDRVRMLAVASGAQDAGKWVRFKRDIVADYHAAFGEAPGRLIGVAIMTDSDNTKQSVTAWYDNIHLRLSSADDSRSASME